MNANGIRQIIDGKVYDTDTAELVTGNDYWDGNNRERSGRNAFLYKTKKGNFFMAYFSMWQGERDYLESISKNEAKRQYEFLPQHRMDYEEAFGEKPEEA